MRNKILKALEDIVNSFDNLKSTDLPTTRSRISPYIDSKLENGEFSLNVYSQNDKILEFLKSDDFKEGDSQTWIKLEELLTEMDNLNAEKANTGPFIKPELTNDRELYSHLNSLRSCYRINTEKQNGVLTIMSIP
jgi:hypothetical protein